MCTVLAIVNTTYQRSDVIGTGKGAKKVRSRPKKDASAVELHNPGDGRETWMSYSDNDDPLGEMSDSSSSSG